MKNTSRIIGGVFALCMASWAGAKDFPDAPIQLVVPYAPGGNMDVTARTVAPFLSEELGVSIIVVNKPGAGGSLGATQVARAKADGYTMMITSAAELGVTPHITNAPYSMDSFGLVGTINTVPIYIGVNTESKYTSVAQLMKEVCAHPDTVTIGHSGIGSFNYVALLQLEDVTKCQFSMVPYSGSGPALLGVLGKQTDVIIDQVSSSKPYLDDNRIRPLVLMSEDRIAGMENKNIPSLSKAGIVGADMTTVAALVVPADTPVQARDKLSAALKKVMHDPQVAAKITALGGTPYTAEQDHFMEIIKSLDTLARKYKADGKLIPQ